jgi:hypothetical protein
VGRIRGWLRRLERESRDEMIAIPLEDGTVARFKPSDLRDAFEVSCAQLCGEDVEPHPLSVAASRSPDPTWRNSAFFGEHVMVDEDGNRVQIGNVPDLSE